MHELLTSAAMSHPVSGNAHGSYVTLRSKNGLIFGVINIIGNFATVFQDQAYWQRAIASRPASTVKAYLLGGLAWSVLLIRLKAISKFLLRYICRVCHSFYLGYHPRSLSSRFDWRSRHESFNSGRRFCRFTSCSCSFSPPWKVGRCGSTGPSFPCCYVGNFSRTYSSLVSLNLRRL